MHSSESKEVDLLSDAVLLLLHESIDPERISKRVKIWNELDNRQKIKLKIKLNSQIYIVKLEVIHWSIYCKKTMM